MKQIPLTRGMFAIVDDDDFQFLNQWNWHSQKGRNTWYAVRSEMINSKQKAIHMHRVILNVEDGDGVVDHRDGNGLNNLKSNLRKCTHQKNLLNKKSYQNGKSKFKGVSPFINRKSVFSSKTGETKVYEYSGWRADITVNKTRKVLGHFKSEIEAAIAYNNAAKKYHDEFARLNQFN